jgi:putative addiction module killer protein
MDDLFHLKIYRDPTGREPYRRWLRGLDESARQRVSIHVDRMRFGNFADSKLVGEGVWELRLHFGPGYRIYYLRNAAAIVLLLCGGDKGSQDGDIRRAKEHARDYRG